MSLLKIFLKQKIKSFHHLQHNTLIQSLTSRKARKKKVNIEKGVSCYTQERRNEINEEKLRLHIKTGGGIPPKEGLFPLMQHNTSMHTLALWKDLPFLNVCTFDFLWHSKGIRCPNCPLHLWKLSPQTLTNPYSFHLVHFQAEN